MSQLDQIITQALAEWSQEDRDEFEERAAIIEYCGGLTRAEAERAAFFEIRKARKARQ